MIRSHPSPLQKLLQRFGVVLVTKEQAEEANRARSLFLAQMSQELRAPLNAILGFSSLLRSDLSVSEEQRRMLDIIIRSGDHLLVVVNNLLAMARTEDGKTAVVRAPVDLCAVMREIAEVTRQPAEAKGLTLALELAEGLPSVILVDEAKLRLVVLDLLASAIKSAETGGVSLRVACRLPEDPSRSTLIIEVVGTGAGVAGTITRQFVELMGGALHLESEPGEGSTFRVELPVEVAAAYALPLPGGPAQRLVRLEPGQPQRRVLIVESQPEDSHLLRHLLEQVGFQVRVALDGAEGVETFRSWRPHFVWMDWCMPVMDGAEATRRIRALEGGRNVKIAALSASVVEEREQVLASGADDLVTKPIQFAAVFACMARLLELRYLPTEPTEPFALSPAPVVELDRNALAALPPSLRADLADALVSLDAARISGWIGRVADADPALGRVLQQLGGQLHYTAILRALRRCDGDAPPRADAP